ncbi:MAG: LssY C-terminal domain-containing protein [bacterium]
MVLWILGSFLILYLAISYFFLPRVWRRYEHHHGLSSTPKRTSTAQGIPGDPVNLALFGTEEALVAGLQRAGWLPADPLKLHSLLKMTESLLAHHPYPTAPVSDLYLFGRKQDLAFEKEVGPTLLKRHHARFWKGEEKGREVWWGAATFDESYCFSRYTGQILHHISPDIDGERDQLVGDLVHAGALGELSRAPGIGTTFGGRNGEGDWYFTDGEVFVGVLSEVGALPQVPREISPTMAYRMKSCVWKGIRHILQGLSHLRKTDQKGGKEEKI